MKRLENLPTLRINTGQAIDFKYRKKKLQGFSGDTVATALYANGIRIFSRSLKYHRPRGLYSLDGESSNTCMRVNGIPNVCTENTLLADGMHLEAQNVSGSPEMDLKGFIDKLDWAMPAGFYYRSMHKPARIWPIALKQVRKAAGLGKISPDFQMTGKYDEIYPAADVCVIGGGPAGMSAALAAAGQGLRVILLEARPWLGGFARNNHIAAVDDITNERPLLFDLETDIAESTDLADRHADVVARLTDLAENARRDLGDYNRIGRGARFFDPGRRRPDAAEWLKPTNTPR